LKTGIKYRLKQKFLYYTSKDWLNKTIAEINRNEPKIILHDNGFQLLPCETNFSIKLGFIIEMYGELLMLLKKRNTSFTVCNDLLCYRFDNLVLPIRTAEEIHIIRELFVDHCYNLALNSVYRVIDIGMNVGFASLFFASNKNVLGVHAFEPFQRTFEDALSNFALNHEIAQKIQCFNYGLDDRDNEVKVNFSSDLKGKNSIKAEINSQLQTRVMLKQAGPVIGSILSQYSEDNFLIKIDCEGCEYAVFKSLETIDLSPRIKAIIVEWHHQGYEGLATFLQNKGFVCYCTGTEEIGLIIGIKN
jgi:FkbM family methyltransferase